MSILEASTAPVQLRNVVRQFGQQRVIDGLDLD
ncbi:MAG: sulfonate ABC transporter ATP-binding protein, partial [Pseudomonas sp.]